MRIACLLIACTAIASCDKPVGPPLDVSELEVFAPLPGSTAGVAYMTLINNTSTAITVGRVASPDFERVEIHESLLDDGVFRMRELDSLVVDPRRPTQLREGGKHLMLMGPGSDVDIGQPVTLLIYYGEDGEIVLRSTLQARVQLEVD